jgi:hypothetical protein
VAGRHRKTRGSQRGRHRKPAQLQRVIVPAATVVVVLGVGGAVADAVVTNGSPHPAGATVIPELVPAPYLPHVPVAPLSPSRPAHHRHRARSHHQASTTVPTSLRIRDVNGPCYVQVTDRSGRLLTRRILTTGQSLTYRRHGLDVVLGNAGAVRLSIDGHRTRRGGGSGEVRRFRVR